MVHDVEENIVEQGVFWDVAATLERRRLAAASADAAAGRLAE
jgi:hypothetical protein